MDETPTTRNPFARQSKVVRRRDPELPAHPLGCEGSEPWSWPSSRWTQGSWEAARPLMSGPAGPTPACWEALPTPQELCGRRGGRRRRRGQQEGKSIMSVCKHLEELKKRQSRIDRLKPGGCGAPASGEGLCGAVASRAEETPRGRDPGSPGPQPGVPGLRGEASFAGGCGLPEAPACSPLELWGFPSILAPAGRPPCPPWGAFRGWGLQPEE